MTVTVILYVVLADDYPSGIQFKFRLLPSKRSPRPVTTREKVESSLLISRIRTTLGMLQRLFVVVAKLRRVHPQHVRGLL